MTPNNYENSESNLTLVNKALEAAREHGLEAEVMWSALMIASESNRLGKSLEVVLDEALSEWDV